VTQVPVPSEAQSIGYSLSTRHDRSYKVALAEWDLRSEERSRFSQSRLASGPSLKKADAESHILIKKPLHCTFAGTGPSPTSIEQTRTNGDFTLSVTHISTLSLEYVPPFPPSHCPNNACTTESPPIPPKHHLIPSSCSLISHHTCPSKSAALPQDHLRPLSPLLALDHVSTLTPYPYQTLPPPPAQTLDHSLLLIF
jgi:hypothetical protein